MSTLANQPVYPPMNLDSGDTGLTLRQHYAGLAMQSLLASLDFAGGEFQDEDIPRAAALALKAADALIIELEKPRP